MMTSSRRAGLGALVVLGLMLAAAPSSAQPTDPQPSAADLESARELYKEGKELRQKGDVRGALERFKAAHGYGQTPVTGLELGKTHLQLGELVEAREVLLSIGRMKVASDETEKSAAARDEAADLAEQIRPRIATLVVKVSPVKPEAPTQVSVDGANTPVVSLSSMRKVNPGEHTIVIRSGDREERRTVTLVESELKEVNVAFSDASPRASSGSDKPVEGGGKSIHVVTWIGLGVGVTGIALGSITGVMALGKASEVTDACQGLSCPPSARETVEDGRSVATLSTIGFAVGAVGLAAAAVGYFVLSPSKRTRASRPHQPDNARFSIGPSFGGIHGTF